MDLSIVILSFNTVDLTINCINSIIDQYKDELEQGRFEIIVVDNASEDLSVEKISKIKIPGLKLIESKENLGFSKGANLGAKNAHGKNILFLNSDTEIKDQGFVKMIDFLDKNEKIGILGGKLKNKDGTNQTSVGKFNFFNIMFGSETLKFLRENPTYTKKVDWVSGASLMIKRKVFKKIGGFENELFMYMEDVDLCFKAFSNNFSTYFYSEITLFHNQRGSSNRTFAILNIYKGILFFYKHHKPKWEYYLAKIILFTKALFLKTVGVVMNNKYYSNTYGEALKLF